MGATSYGDWVMHRPVSRPHLTVAATGHSESVPKLKDTRSDVYRRITSIPPIHGRNTSGMTMAPSACW